MQSVKHGNILSQLKVFLVLGLDFTKDGKFMALAERRNCKDFISIFACSTWQLVKVLQCIFNG